MNMVSAKSAPIIVHRQSVHLRSSSEIDKQFTPDWQLAEGIQLLLEHSQIIIKILKFKFNIIANSTERSYSRQSIAIDFA